MGITNAKKELSVSSIDCFGSFEVKLSLTAVPNIATNPTDMVLILDRSGSMTGSPLANLKEGAKTFIDIMDEATDGVKDGNIGFGSRIGVVSFSTEATQDTTLITSVSALNQAVDALTAGGYTNHTDAFTKAVSLFDPTSTNAKVMIMFTDGKTTIDGNASGIAAAAKAQGILIYVIGLSGNGGLDEAAIRNWASDPDSEFVSITPDEEDLVKLFADLAQTISQPGAQDVGVTDKVADCFEITAFTSPTKGTAEIKDGQTIEWKIDKLGSGMPETAELVFTVKHIGPCTGTVEVNEFTHFTDKEGQDIRFNSPEITVNCDEDLITVEACPQPVEIAIDGCTDAIEYDAGELNLSSLGRILQLDVTVKNVCPNRRVALAAILTEVDQFGLEYKRGLKTMTIPAHNRSTCQDIRIKCLKFVLPEDLDVSGDESAICNTRNFKARLIAHYIDHDFECCDIVL